MVLLGTLTGSPRRPRGPISTQAAHVAAIAGCKTATTAAVRPLTRSGR